MASYRRAGANLYDLVDRFLNDGFSVNTPLKNIILDVQEFDDKFIVEADVPGVDKKDINVTFNNDYLKISLESSEEENNGAAQAQPSAADTVNGASDKATVDVAGEAGSTSGTEAGSSSEAEGSAGATAEPKAEANASNTGGSQQTHANGEDDDDHYIHRERMYATVSRVIYLKGATSKGIKAELKDGVLTLTVPKREDAMNQNQKIEID